MTNQGIHFSQLPYLLQRAIIGKFSLQRFADFEQCSRASMLIYKEHISIKFPHEVDYLLLKDQFATVGIDGISWYLEFFANVLFRVKTRLTVKPPIVPALLTFLRTNVIESKRLDVNEPIRYPNDLIPILKKLKVEELHVTLNNIDEVPAYVHGVSEAHFYGDHYIILERVTVTLDCVTLDPIVAFVQEWLDGCVDFKEKTIFFCERSFQPNEMHDALESIGKYIKVKLKKEIVDYFVFKKDEDNFPMILVIYSDLIDFFVGDPDLYEFCDYE